MSKEYKQITPQIRGSMSYRQKDLIIELVERKNERGKEQELRDRGGEQK